MKSKAKINRNKIKRKKQKETKKETETGTLERKLKNWEKISTDVHLLSIFTNYFNNLSIKKKKQKQEL